MWWVSGGRGRERLINQEMGRSAMLVHDISLLHLLLHLLALLVQLGLWQVTSARYRCTVTYVWGLCLPVCLQKDVATDVSRDIAVFL